MRKRPGELWVVYRVSGAAQGPSGVCEQHEWDAMELAQPGQHKLVRKGIAMFQKVNVPILGIVENMSYYTTPTGDRIELFGHGGGKTEAARQNVPFLGEIPIYVSIREGGDASQPIVVTDPDSHAGRAFVDVAINVQRQLTK